ncbi:hypothetical protein N665_0069s0031 [Sinapis alba]|nr:hypothetical protein N665_0069s0031 [Sinapis alba]
MNDERKADKKKGLIRKSTINGGKRVQEPVNTELVVDISEGFTKDERDLTQPHRGPEFFRVMAWIDEEGLCIGDPGTSNGTVVMGRAKIRLPPWTSRDKFTSKFNLVGLNSDRCVEIKGYLNLSMQLDRYFEL